MKITDNRLLLGTIISFAAYWICGTYLPWDWFSPFVTLSLVVCSGLVWMRTLPETLAILFKGRRNEEAPEGDGSHLAVLGSNWIGLGGLLAAMSTFALLIPWARPHVAGTPFETLGRAIATAGMGLWFVSPHVTRRGVRFDGGVWLYVVAAVTMVLIYAIGYNAGYREDHPVAFVDDEHIPNDRPKCSVDRPIWGSQSGVYHSMRSIYRRQVIPVRCFASEEEARAAGYRAPG